MFNLRQYSDIKMVMLDHELSGSSDEEAEFR
jgi:hypothetical protein